MEVKSITKKIKSKSVGLPFIDVDTLRYGSSSRQLIEDLSPLKRKFGKYGGVCVLLPNFRYKKDKFYFYMKNPYDMSYSFFLLKQIYTANYFFIKTDLPGLSKIQVHYELMKEEKEDGLLCKIYLENSRDFGNKDYQGMCKMIEMTILNMNPTDTYEFISYQDIYLAEGEYSHIYEKYEDVEVELKEVLYSKEKKEYTSEGYHYIDENQENEEFNS